MFLSAILHTGDISMTEVSRRLGFSRSTLHRRLEAEGVRFEQILDDLRRRMALDYLDGRKVSINEAAYLTAISDPSAFSRAFRRWTGMSPGHYHRLRSVTSDRTAMTRLPRQILLQASVVIALAAVSWLGNGWGLLVIYLMLLVTPLVLIGVVELIQFVRRRVRHEPLESGASAMRCARILASFTVAVVVVAATHGAVAVVARSGDGPIGMYPGGALSGEMVNTPVHDWTFAGHIEEIELQVTPTSPRSITTHAYVHNGDLYVPADFVIPFKRWVYDVERDDRVLVRIDGRLYPRRAVRVLDRHEIDGVLDTIAERRGISRDALVFATEVWFFRMDPPAEPGS